MCIKTQKEKKKFLNLFFFSKEFLRLNPLVECLEVNFGIAFDYCHLQLRMMPCLPCRVEDPRLLSKTYRHSLSIDYSHLGKKNHF